MAFLLNNATLFIALFITTAAGYIWPSPQLDALESLRFDLDRHPIFPIITHRGPDIPFRGGRLDAAKPNAPGVPQPQDDLKSHIASFARQDSPISSAKEYMSGTTLNPLVVGSNDTTNSDKRIFSSDGNVTMNSFAQSPELFASTCSTLFARMLDTVPRGVKLTEVITPLPVKPDNLQLTLDGDKLLFSGQVRLWNMTEDDDRTVLLLWEDRVGGSHNATLNPAGVSNGGRTTAAWYAFDEPGVILDPTAGVTRMRFSVAGKLYDQSGIGFAVQDSVVFSTSSCLTAPNSSPIAGRFDVAVCPQRRNVTRVFLEDEIKDSVGRITVVETDFPRPSHMNMTQTSSTRTVGAEIDGVAVSTGRLALLFELPDCPGA
ncbi:hypothetical protein K438DRAFT_1843111 [Mycena galopus ATCC 62051]|nr:hypothetical protein K438DRAFT_1843111 [Mycena galopus ATCC 62051]